MNNGWIFCLKDFQNYILVGTDEKVVKFYSKKTMECVEELYGHEDSITFMEIGSKFLFTSSLDHSIRSWDISEIENRIRERRIMEREELMSRKMEAYNKVMDKKGKKKGKATEKISTEPKEEKKKGGGKTGGKKEVKKKPEGKKKKK